MHVCDRVVVKCLQLKGHSPLIGFEIIICEDDLITTTFQAPRVLAVLIFQVLKTLKPDGSAQDQLKEIVEGGSSSRKCPRIYKFQGNFGFRQAFSRGTMRA